MPRKVQDLTGWIMKEHGVPDSQLTVIRPDPDKPRYWICRCECGNEKSIRRDHLFDGSTKTCGHGTSKKSTNTKKIDMTGWVMKEHGIERSRLTVIDQAPHKNGRVAWNCICECGNKTIVLGTALRDGSILSCGCLAHDAQFIDMTGWKMWEHGVPSSQFEVIRPVGKAKDGNTIWECKCSCGKIHNVNGSDLRRGQVRSCGCLYSAGEKRIGELLREANIKYKEQKTFPDCLLETGNKAKFDFYIEDKYLIEYDGQQHFKCENWGWNTKEQFENTQLRDKIKNQWCIDNNIPLIRIPYTRLNNLCLEDLLLETSQFIYKPDKTAN